jgi:hypothetical protein
MTRIKPNKTMKKNEEKKKIEKKEKGRQSLVAIRINRMMQKLPLQ